MQLALKPLHSHQRKEVFRAKRQCAKRKQNRRTEIKQTKVNDDKSKQRKKHLCMQYALATLNHTSEPEGGLRRSHPRVTKHSKRKTKKEQINLKL